MEVPNLGIHVIIVHMLGMPASADGHGSREN